MLATSIAPKPVGVVVKTRGTWEPLDGRRRTDEKRALDREAFAFGDIWGSHGINGKEHMKRMSSERGSVRVQRNTDGARPRTAGNLIIGMEVSSRDACKQQNQRDAAPYDQATPARNLELALNHHRQF